MADAEIPRTIRLPAKLWDAVDRDAVRCKRSAVKQVEAVLMTYYGLENTEISRERLTELRNAAGQASRIVAVPMEGELTDELQKPHVNAKATQRGRRKAKTAK